MLKPHGDFQTQDFLNFQMTNVVLKLLYTTNQWPPRLKQVESPDIITHYTHTDEDMPQ